MKVVKLNYNFRSQLIKLIQLTVLMLIVSGGLVLHWYVRREVLEGDAERVERVIEVKTKVRRMRGK